MAPHLQAHSALVRTGSWALQETVKNPKVAQLGPQVLSVLKGLSSPSLLEDKRRQRKTMEDTAVGTRSWRLSEGHCTLQIASATPEQVRGAPATFP